MIFNFSSEVETRLDYDSKAPGNYKYESHYSKTVIKYTFAFNENSWGISNVSLFVQNQPVSLKVELQDPESGEGKEVSLELILNGIRVNAEEVKLSRELCPRVLNLKIKEIREIKPGLYEGQAEGELEF